MRTIYRALTLVLVALAAVQAAGVAWFVGGAMSWLDEGGTLTDGMLWSDAPPFNERYGLDANWFIGSVVMPVAALAVLGVAVAWRNELAILAGLALVGLAFVQALILNDVLAGLAVPAIQGAIIVAIAAIAAFAPKGAAWAAAHRDKVRASYAHTPLAA